MHTRKALLAVKGGQALRDLGVADYNIWREKRNNLLDVIRTSYSPRRYLVEVLRIAGRV